jgi:lipoate-protein ligase A
MHILDRTLPTAVENLALDEALLLAAESGEGGELLRLWEWPRPAVVLGAGCRLAEDVNEPACRADTVPVLRRASGGGTVLLGAGCLCFSLVLSYARDQALTEIASSYAYIFDRTLQALAGVLPGMERAGTSDLAAGGRKFSGNAQQRKRAHLLHHGTLLYGFDVESVGRYLRLPARRPEYRGDRAHGEFLTNLPVGVEELRRRLCEAWGADTELATWPENRIDELVREKYVQAGWIRRR